MAIVLDLARVTDTVLCASVRDWTDTVRAPFPSAFTLEAAGGVETHIPQDEDTGVPNSTDAWVPHVSFDTFWFDAIPATVRP